MQKGIKFRIYPNKEQKNLIHQTFFNPRKDYKSEKRFFIKVINDTDS